MATKCSTCIKPYSFESCCFCHDNQAQDELTEEYLRILELRRAGIKQRETNLIGPAELRSHMAV